MDDSGRHHGRLTEWKLRAGSVPVAIALALAFHSCDTGHFAQRTALSMPLHELGHAISGWWSGYASLPGLWKTTLPETRGVVISIFVFALEAYILWRAWSTQRMDLFALGLGLALAQLYCTTQLSPIDVEQLFTFCGDAGAMVLGTILMMTFFCDEESRLRAGGLRYGLISIGAAAFIDTFATWWSARTDTDAIPFGEIEGVGLSDPSKLQEQFGWATQTIVDRYVLVGTLCLAVLVAVWARATYAARSDTSPR
jgi:hypothetical protein